MLGVSADQGQEDPGSEERRLRAPALLRKISPDRTAAGQEQEEQGGGKAGAHCGNKLTNIYIYLYLYITAKKFKWVLHKSCLFTLRGHHRKAKSVQQLLM